LAPEIPKHNKFRGLGGFLSQMLQNDVFENYKNKNGPIFVEKLKSNFTDFKYATCFTH